MARDIPWAVSNILSILSEAAKHQDASVRQVALQELASLARANPSTMSYILPILTTAANDSNASVRRVALQALASLVRADSSTMPDILPKLKKATKDQDASVRRVAFQELASLAHANPSKMLDILPILQKGTKALDTSIRLIALKALASKAVSELKPDIYHHAIKALAKMAMSASSEQETAHESALPDPDPEQKIIPECFKKALQASRKRVQELGDELEAQKAEHQQREEHYKQQEEHYKQQIVRLKALSRLPKDPSQPKKSPKKNSAINNSLVIDAAVWEKHFGAVGEQPALPDDIEKILDSQCPFWPKCKVRDTHLLALIPARVAGEPLTLNYLGQLITGLQANHGKQYQFSSDRNLHHIMHLNRDTSYWVLMTRYMLPEGYSKNYKDQWKLVNRRMHDSKLAYKLPHALELAILMVLYAQETGEDLYPHYNARCAEIDKLYPALEGNPGTKVLTVKGVDPKSKGPYGVVPRCNLFRLH